MSMYTGSFYPKCFWSIIKSESILGETKFTIDMIVKKTSMPIETTEMHAPENVPSLY